MTKKSGVETVTTHVAGVSGKGPLMSGEIMAGSKKMSTAHPKLDTAGPKMSSAHGTNGQSKSNNMNQGGKARIGVNCKGFGHGNYRQAGPKSWGHAKQPKGHKDSA